LEEYPPKKSHNINLANTLAGQPQIFFADHSNPNVRTTHPPPPGLGIDDMFALVMAWQSLGEEHQGRSPTGCA